MDSYNQCSWWAGDSSNMYPSSRSDEDQYKSCYICQATDHRTIDCPMNPCSPNYQEEARGNPSFVEPLWGSNQWQQTDSSPRGQQGVTSSFGQSFGTQVDTQEEEKLPDMDGMLGLVSSMVSAMKKLEERTTQELEAHATRIMELEQTKSHGGEIMEAQAQRIESLEAKVQELETRLKHQQNEQSQRHEAHLRRIKQIHIEVPHLREQLGRVNSKVCRVHEEQVKYLHSNHKDDSSDDMTDFGEEPTLGEMTPTSLPPFAINEERGSDLDSDDFLRPYSGYFGHMEIFQAENGNTEGVSCGCCGLHCQHQLRAFVNMTHAMPSMSKVKEKEIPVLKRTTKRKLQRIWVPSGVFEVKELFRVDTVPEDQCAKSYMPRWKKRKRRTPATNDSCD